MKIEFLLEQIKSEIENLSPVPKEYLVSQGSKNGFELLVPEVLQKILKDNQESFDYKVHYGHHFPDIDIYISDKKYGIELKSRNNNTFVTNGNSVFEGITTTDYDEIFIVFGTHDKTNSTPTIRVKHLPYWKATTSIVVTHSPRFRINMSGESSVFESAAEYHTLRGKSEIEKSNFIQTYLKNNIEGTKWFISKEKSEVKPIQINTLSNDVKNQLIAELLIIYPQDLLKSIKNERTRADYSRCTEYLITNYFYYSSSIRDLFSSGGSWEYKSIKLPKIFKKFIDHQILLIDILETASPDFKKIAINSWNELNIQLTGTFKDKYIQVLNYLGGLYYPKTLSCLKLNYLSNLLIIE